MATISTFEELLVWQKAHKLTLHIYTLSNSYPKHEIFSLVSQSRRAAISVSANIVEGFRRKNLRDSLNFYNVADASLEELKYHILLAKDLLYINEKEHQETMVLCEEVGKLLTRWIQSQRKFLA